MSFFFQCCKRKNKIITKEINKLDTTKKEEVSIDVNQSLSMMSNNLSNSTKDNILVQNQKKFNIINQKNEMEALGKKPENYNNVIYNIFKVGNINTINNNREIEIKYNKIDSMEKELDEREKKLFENESKLSKKEKEINNKLLELIKRNKKLNEIKKSPRANVISDIIKYKQVAASNETNNNHQTNK